MERRPVKELPITNLFTNSVKMGLAAFAVIFLIGFFITRNNSTVSKIDLQNPDLGKVYTGIVAEDCVFLGKPGRFQPLKVIADNSNGQDLDVSADVSYPQVQSGYKEGQPVRFFFWIMALGSKPIPLLIPDFFEH